MSSTHPPAVHPPSDPDTPLGPEAEAVAASAEVADDQPPDQTDDDAGQPGEPDADCAAAAPLARAAVEELAEAGTVGDHLGVTAEGHRLVTHSFACLSKGYRGWRWAVTVARAPQSSTVTVCEVVLLPGADAVLAPTWVPWAERLAPGDLGASDVLPYRRDDPNLVPGYAVTDEDDLDEAAFWELGLGRVRMLGLEGRDAASERWYRGSHGPMADVALNAAANCSTCGYFLPVAGALRQMFGVCANEWSPSDGTVVSADHGCGAHSETDLERVEPESLPEPILDETGYEPVVVARAERLEPGEELEAEADTQLEPEAEADTEAEPEAEPEAEAVAQAEPEAEAEAEAEPEAEPPSGLSEAPSDDAPMPGTPPSP